MALARGILLWLPLERLLTLYEKLPEELVRERVLTLNRVADEEVRRLAGELQLPYAARHLWLSTIQGELHRYSPSFLPVRFLQYRALILRDVPMYLRCTALLGPQIRYSVEEIQQVYQSGRPELIAMLLASLNGRPLQLEDPFSLRWTPGLRAATIAYLTARRVLDDSELPLAGWLQFQSLADWWQTEPYRRRDYANGFVRARCQPGEPALSNQEVELLQRIFPGPTLNDFLAREGCSQFVGKINYVSKIGIFIEAANQIQPRILRLLTAEDNTILQTILKSEPTLRKQDMITLDLLERSRETLRLAQERGWPWEQPYLQFLRGLLGEKIVHQEEEVLEYWLETVASPVATYTGQLHQQLPFPSVVYYDMAKLVEHSQGKELRLPAVFAFGQLWPLRRQENFRKLFRLEQDSIPAPARADGLTAEGLRYRQLYGVPVASEGTNWSLPEVLALEEKLGPRPGRENSQTWSTGLQNRYLAFLARMRQEGEPPIVFDRASRATITTDFCRTS